MILVLAEQREGVLNRATWEAIAAAQALAAGDTVAIAAVGDAIDGPAQELAAAGVGDVMTVQHPALAHYTPDAWVQAAAGVIAAVAPRYVILPHTYEARDFAPLLSARLRIPLVTDVTAISGSGDAALFARPMFQGKLAAQVRPKALSNRSAAVAAIVTIQIGAFRADAVSRGSAVTPRALDVAIDSTAVRQKPEPPFREAKQAVDLSQAQRIVSVGRGIKSQENLPIAEKLAAALDAELAASRPICDSGWLPMERQIGSSGQTVAPKLYVALGISGAIQHLVGMKGSRTIVAINKDPDAPIFEVADYGIVGDLFEIVPAIVAALEKP